MRATARGFFHPTGTCAIGTVVDERGRVLRLREPLRRGRVDHADDPAREHEPDDGRGRREARRRRSRIRRVAATSPTGSTSRATTRRTRCSRGDPMALLIGFALDQQVPVPTAFSGPLKLKQRVGTLDPARRSTDDGARARVPREAGDPSLPGRDGEARPGPRGASSTRTTAAMRSGSGRGGRRRRPARSGSRRCRASAR